MAENGTTTAAQDQVMAPPVTVTPPIQLALVHQVIGTPPQATVMQLVVHQPAL